MRQIEDYRQKISEPLLDRIDLHDDVPLVDFRDGCKTGKDLYKLDSEGRGYLEHATEQMNLSARAHDRILKVSRTLADLAGKQNITGNEVLEAIQFRSLDRRLFE